MDHCAVIYSSVLSNGIFYVYEYVDVYTLGESLIPPAITPNRVLRHPYLIS